MVETFDRVEQAYVQRYGRSGPKWLAWDGFFAALLYRFVLAPVWTKQAEDIERQIWALYEQFMGADDGAFWGDGDEKGLLGPLLQYEESQAEKKRRIEMWRDRQPKPAD